MYNVFFLTKSIDELREIAVSSATDGTVLYELAQYIVSQKEEWDSISFLSILRSIAENKSADEKLLDYICDIALSEEKCQTQGLNYGCLQMVFKNVASNLNTRSVTFKKLLDNKIHVREYIAENPSLSDELLLYMVDNTNNSMVLAIAAKQLAVRYRALLNK